MKLSRAAALLEGRISGRDVSFVGCSIDSRSVRAGELFIALRGNQFDGHTFAGTAIDKGASAALVEEVNQPESSPLLLVADTKQAMSRLAEIWRDSFDIPIVAITGSNGKTTVKEMISSILGLHAQVLSTRGNLNNDIGVPLTLFGLGTEHKYAVIELGANHPGEIARLSKLVKPRVALITQCAPAHLQGFGSIEGVARAKAEIYSGLAEDGTAIVNADDEYAGYWTDVSARYRRISFGIKNKADITASNLSFEPVSGRTVFMLNTHEDSIGINIGLPGTHNVMNSLAAAACCLAIDITLSDIKHGLEKLSSINGRMQMKFTSEGMRIFDDTYNANPGSLKAGLDVISGFGGRRWLVLGDMGELGDQSVEMHRQAGELARLSGIERLYTLGNLGFYAAEGFGSGAQAFNDIDGLFSSLSQHISPDITLLVKGSRLMAMDRIVNLLMKGV